MSKRPCYECKHRRHEGFSYHVCKLTARDPVNGLRQLTKYAREKHTCSPEPTLLIRLKELL